MEFRVKVNWEFKNCMDSWPFVCILVSSKAILERPAAGSQVPFCLVEKKMLDSWSWIEPGTFRVRGEHYYRWALYAFLFLTFYVS